MADIATNILEVGNNRLILQDAEARTKINDMYITDTASGAIASFPDGAAMPVKSITVDVEPVQDLHGQANPYPAGGGKNLLPLTVSAIKAANTRGTWSGNVYTDSTGTKFTISLDSDGNVNGITVNGTGSNVGILYLRAYDVPNGSYTVNGVPSGASWGGSNNTFRIRIGDKTDAYINDCLSNGVTVNTTNGFNLQINVASGYAANNLTFKPMIRLSSVSDATFAPYSNICPISGHTQAVVTVSPTTDAQDGTSYTIDLDGTRYGGTLDVTTGVLTVDRAMVDLGSLTWNYDSGLTRYESSVINDMKPSAARSGYILSDRYQSITDGRPSGNVPNNSIYTVIEKKIFVVDNAYSSASSFKTAVTGSLAIYPLAEPQTVQLTANEISTLLGQNNIWNDCGDTEVEYRADTKLYIQKVMSS